MVNKALIIDDDEISLLLAGMVLEENSFARKIDTALSGAEALNYLKQASLVCDPPQVIFLDLNMPVMDGWEFLDEFEKTLSGKLPKIKIIILSSTVDPGDRKRAEDNEMIDQFISKPLTKEAVTELINGLAKEIS